MKTILFVCTGNVCRSPMAEGIFRHAMKGRRDIQVLSAGIGAMDGQPPSPYAVQAVKELARERIGTVPVARVVPDRKKKKSLKHKETLPKLLTEE